MAVRGHQAHGGHQLDGLQHDQRNSRCDGPETWQWGPANTMSHQLPGQQSEGLLVIKQISQPNLIVHDCLQTLYTFQLNSVPLGVTKNYHLVEHVWPWRLTFWSTRWEHWGLASAPCCRSPGPSRDCCWWGPLSEILYSGVSWRETAPGLIGTECSPLESQTWSLPRTCYSWSTCLSSYWWATSSGAPSSPLSGSCSPTSSQTPPRCPADVYITMVLGEVRWRLESSYLVTHLSDVPTLFLCLIEVSQTVGLGKLTRRTAATTLTATQAPHHLVQLEIWSDVKTVISSNEYELTINKECVCTYFLEIHYYNN